MADVALAIAEVIRQEDSTLSGVITNDQGGRTRFGIAERFHPWIADIGFYTTMGQERALGAALVIYLREYAQPLNIQSIPDQSLGEKLLSLGVNVGIVPAAKWLQEAVGSFPDGNIGPATIAAIAKADSKKALDGLKQQAIAFYQQLAKDNPADTQYLNGWIARANA